MDSSLLQIRGFYKKIILYVRWDSLTTEFFDDDAVLKISCYLEDGLKHFAVSKAVLM